MTPCDGTRPRQRPANPAYTPTGFTAQPTVCYSRLL